MHEVRLPERRRKHHGKTVHVPEHLKPKPRVRTRLSERAREEHGSAGAILFFLLASVVAGTSLTLLGPWGLLCLLPVCAAGVLLA